MAHEGVREALGLDSDQWASIKSAGRQGVARAFAEGGTRKAKLKLAKMLTAAARTQETGVPTDAAREKKKRRRAIEACTSPSSRAT